MKTMERLQAVSPNNHNDTVPLIHSHVRELKEATRAKTLFILVVTACLRVSVCVCVEVGGLGLGVQT